MPSVTTRPLVGRDEQRRKRWAIVAVALFFGSLLWFAVVKAVDYPRVHLLLWWEGYAVLLIGLVAVQAYSGGGIALSWALAFGAVVGLVLNYGGIGLTGSGPGWPELIGFALVGGTVTAAVVGTIGFVLGDAARRLVG